MPGIEIKGRSKIANYRHGGRTGKFGGGRTNLLEELGRVEAEPSNRNRRAEISRVHGELNRGYAKGGRAGFKFGGTRGLKGVVKRLQERKEKKRLSTEERKLRPTGLGAAHGGRISLKRDPRSDPEKKRKKDLAKLAIEHEEGKKDYKPKSYLEKDTEKQAELTTIGKVKKYKPFPKHMNWHTGYVKSDAYKDLRKREADYIEAHGREGFKKGGKADKKWIQKAVNPKH